MTSRKWKPGDVARIVRKDIVPIDVTAIWTGEFWAWSDGDGPFDGVSHCHPSFDAEFRPLVVIDPEDREQVKRLLDAMGTRGWTGLDHEAPSDMQAALRSLVAPPKPEEPTGLGAVVEDAAGVKWVRSGSWQSECGNYECGYANIDAVRVLSPGVEV